MKHILTICITIIMLSAACASEAPGYDPTDRVVPKTTHAVVGQLVSCTTTNEPGNHVLMVNIRPIRTLWGQNLTNSVSTRYEEFIPVFDEHINISYMNYTGSGIEFKTKPKQTYICFLKKHKGTFLLLRLEPIDNEKAVLQLHKKQKDVPQH